jgi:pimeloyl-ACP methyl ester carboxylesterase
VTSVPATSDPPSRRLEFAHGPLSFVDEGPPGAPALFAVHGIPGSVRDFRYLAPLLVPRLRFVRVDLPGFGGSAPHSRAVSRLDGRVESLLDLADHLGLRRFAVLGHSMGGATAVVAAAEHRERVSALVLLASIGLRPHRGLGMSARRFRMLGHGFAVPVLRSVLVRVARERYRRRRFPGADTMDAATFGVHFKAIGAADFERLRRAFAAPLPPTLLAFARDDHMVEAAIQDELRAALPSARVLEFDEGGHNIQKTRAPELAAGILELLGAGAL